MLAEHEIKLQKRRTLKITSKKRLNLATLLVVLHVVFYPLEEALNWVHKDVVAVVVVEAVFSSSQIHSFSLRRNNKAGISLSSSRATRDGLSVHKDLGKDLAIWDLGI